ncbi:hypothetical protein [Burkholderia pyrrocinia]|uniref:hypothetical protein n=1 Tax=Burkholderia pyrrocinia TaxID=60550 RepID=UPI0030CACF59
MLPAAHRAESTGFHVASLSIASVEALDFPRGIGEAIRDSRVKQTGAAGVGISLHLNFA